MAVEGIEGVGEAHVAAARALDMHVKLVGRATLADGRCDVRVGPALVDAHHPLAAVEGAFNAVMLQGDAIREIMLEGPGAGGSETASAVVADMVSVVGTTGSGFLQADPVWRQLERLPAGRARLALVPANGGRRPAPACSRESRSGSPTRASRSHGSSSSRRTAARSCTWSRTRRRAGAWRRRSTAIRALPESRGTATALPVVSERGVAELGWT